jgi:hypothetical protein
MKKLMVTPLTPLYTHVVLPCPCDSPILIVRFLDAKFEREAITRAY